MRILLSIARFRSYSIKKPPEITGSSYFRNIHNAPQLRQEQTEKNVVRQGTFEKVKNKNKDTYLDLIRIFINRDHMYRRGHVDFIYAALKHMEEFGVEKDLKVYRELIDVLPKGKLVATNMLQVEFMHYPKQQQCVIDLLQQMEDNGVMPDAEMQDQLMNIFGKNTYPLRKYWRMMYWMPKMKHANPFPVPRKLPDDILEIAKIAISRMTTSVDLQTKISEYQTKDIEHSIDDTWIVSAQSPTQKALLKKHNPKEPVYVEGSFQVWVRDKLVNYFTLRANSKPLPDEVYDEDDVSNIRIPLMNLKPPCQKHITERATVHEQDDGTILALCATGTSSKDSLLSWIRHLERDGNELLGKVPVVFTLRSATREIQKSQPPDEQGMQPLQN